MSDISNQGTGTNLTGSSLGWGGPLQSIVTPLINLGTIISKLQQTVSTAFSIWNGTTATSATSGSASALPATPAGYAIFINPSNGQQVKVPFYNT